MNKKALTEADIRTNFGEALLKDGITRCVNRMEEDVPPENVAQRRGDAENQTSPPQRLGGRLC